MILNNYASANFNEILVSIEETVRSFDTQRASERDRRAFIERIDVLYREISEKELDVDATLASNQRLVSDALDFIREHYESKGFDRSTRTSARASFEQALGLLDEILEAAKAESDRFLFSEAIYFQGRILEARFDFRGALKKYDLAMLNSEAPQHYALAAATCARKLCNHDLAVAYLERLVTRSSRAGLSLMDRCRALNELGALKEAEYDLEAAIACLAEANGLSPEIRDVDDLPFKIKNNIGHCLLSNNDPIAALPFVSRAYEFFQSNRERYRADYIAVSQNMAEALRKIHEFKRMAYPPFLPHVRSLVEGTPEFGEIERAVGRYARRELDEAEIILMDSLSFARRTYGHFGSHPIIANVLNNYGVFLLSQRGAEAEGLKLVREAAEMMQSLFTEFNPRLVNMLINLGVIEGRADPSQGLTRLRRAELLARRLLSEDDPIFDVILEERTVIEARVDKRPN